MSVDKFTIVAGRDDIFHVATESFWDIGGSWEGRPPDVTTMCDAVVTRDAHQGIPAYYPFENWYQQAFLEYEFCPDCLFALGHYSLALCQQP